MDDAVAMSVRGRTAKQDRSERTRGAILSAVVATLADPGVAGLTHRLVAKRSGASLAATTYYFDSKQDMVAAASNELLHGFLADFTLHAAEVQGGGAAGFYNFIARLAANGVGDPGRRALAWCEIVLDGARHPQARALVHSWFERLVFIWEQIARAFGVPHPTRAAYAGMHVSLGAVFQGLALGLGREQLRATFRGEPEQVYLLPPAASAVATGSGRLSPRAAATRERILDAAIRLLAGGGAGAVNCRSVALEAGLTPGTAAYHFASSKALLAEAEALLFLRSKARHDATMDHALEGRDLDTLVELMTAILAKETTDYGSMNLAGHAVWLQAARDPELRPLVREIFVELYGGWRRILAALDADLRGPEPMVLQYLFFGEMVRALAAGATAEDLKLTGRRLRADVREIVEGRHWIQSALGAA